MASSSDSGSVTAGNSKQTVLTSLVYNGAIFLVFIALFLVLRPRHNRVYEKRVYSDIVPDNQKPRPLTNGVVAWVKDLLRRSDAEILRDTGLDGYFFLRYVRFLFYLSLLGMVILMPILLPVNATNGHNLEGLDLLGFGNIINHNRYFAHVFLSWIFYGLTMFFIYRESLFYIALRQAVLTSESQRYLLSSRTVLINSVPVDLLDEDYIRSIFPGVKHVFIGRDAKKVAEAVEKRDKLASKLEGAENKVLQKGTKKRVKAENKGKPDSDDLWSYVKKPTHKLGKLALIGIGKKVETLDYAIKEIPTMNINIAKLQEANSKDKKLAAAFVVFHTQAQAEQAVQMLAFHRPLQFAPRTIGVRPDEVIWENLRLKWWQRLIKRLGASTFCTLLCIFWAIPVAFVGFISQIDQLIKLFPWLSFLHKLPTVLYGLISSLLPTILLAVLMMLLPIMIRKAAKISGAPTQTEVEYYTQNVYFAFQVIQVFLVVSLASSILSSLDSILKDPSSILSLLQTKLPSASNFFINWMLLQSLTVPSGALLQIVALILFYVLGALLDNTPRKRWNRQNAIGGTGWGTVMPVYSLMAVVMFTYSIISPLIMPFAAVLFLFVYICNLNNLSFVSGKTNGRGIYFARGLQHLFVGIYLSEIVLIILFVFAKSWGPVVLEVAFGLFTVWFHVNLDTAFAPLLFVLPQSLLDGEQGPSVPLLRKEKDPFSDTIDTVQSKLSSEVDASAYRAQTNQTANTQPESSMLREHDTEKQDKTTYKTASTPPPKGGLLHRIFKPHLYYTPENLEQELLQDDSWHTASTPLDPKDEAQAFHDPSVTAPNPVVWFPADPYGWSEGHLAKLQKAGINAHTNGSWIEVKQQKKKKKPELEWSKEVSEIPVYSPDAAY